MNKKTIIILVLLVAILGIAWLLTDQTEFDQEELVNGQNDQQEVGDIADVEELLERLPFEEEIGGRTVVFDQESVEELGRDEFSQAQGQILEEDELNIQPGEDPIEYTQRIIRMYLSPELVEQLEDDAFNYSVSVYPAEEIEGGLSIYVEVMNMPHDVLLGGQDRYDFVSTEDGWEIDWIGSRMFCQDEDDQFWQPADSPCPGMEMQM